MLLMQWTREHKGWPHNHFFDGTVGPMALQPIKINDLRLILIKSIMVRVIVRWLLVGIFLILSFGFLSGVFFTLGEANKPVTGISPEWSLKLWHSSVLAGSCAIATILSFMWLRKPDPKLDHQPIIKSRLLTTSIFIVVGLFAYFYPDIQLVFEIDKCLDLGGAWDYDRALCDYGAAP